MEYLLVLFASVMLAFVADEEDAFAFAHIAQCMRGKGISSRIAYVDHEAHVSGAMLIAMPFANSFCKSKGKNVLLPLLR